MFLLIWLTRGLHVLEGEYLNRSSLCLENDQGFKNSGPVTGLLGRVCECFDEVRLTVLSLKIRVIVLLYSVNVEEYGL